MAALTDSDFSELRAAMYQGGSVAKAQIKTLPVLPSSGAWRAGFQAINDRYVADRPNYKAALDTALGVTTSPALAKEFERAWHTWWARKG